MSEHPKFHVEEFKKPNYRQEGLLQDPRLYNTFTCDERAKKRLEAIRDLVMATAMEGDAPLLFFCCMPDSINSELNTHGIVMGPHLTTYESLYQMLSCIPVLCENYDFASPEEIENMTIKEMKQRLRERISDDPLVHLKVMFHSIHEQMKVMMGGKSLPESVIKRIVQDAVNVNPALIESIQKRVDAYYAKYGEPRPSAAQKEKDVEFEAAKEEFENLTVINPMKDLES